MSDRSVVVSMAFHCCCLRNERIIVRSSESDVIHADRASAFMHRCRCGACGYVGEVPLELPISSSLFDQFDYPSNIQAFDGQKIDDIGS